MSRYKYNGKCKVWYSPEKNELFLAWLIAYDFIDKGLYWFESAQRGQCVCLGEFFDD